ncbi:hypothetical protein PMZ80_001493 [Knufia obscura]|uniref:Putative transcription factor kapC n=1 Tax=Knufia obscura TaxID=1635080 RepID=A0ABR0S4F5_9EURO|nr:hypothetical protein PMZ80_001493 [Knufia obscura]
MTSITQLLSPWPVAKSHSIVLRDQPDYTQAQAHSIPPPPSYQPVSDAMLSAQAQPVPTSPSATSPQQTSDHSDGDGQADGRKGYGKRELSTSKRAAQNRAAQRAFRQRKEGYIKKLEEQVRDYQALSDNFKAVQAENYQLRDYIINLQSRLLESQHEVPPPPSNVDGLQPGKAQQSQHATIQQPPHIPAVNTQQQVHTLPRIAEMGSASTTPPHDQQSVHPSHNRSPSLGTSYGFEQTAKRIKTSPTMTPAQSALQGNAVLNPGQTSR